MNERKAFNFYRSYYEVAKELPDDQKTDFLMAILEVQFTGKHRELKGLAKLAFISQKHSIDSQLFGYKNRLKRKDPNQAPKAGGKAAPKAQEQVEGQGKGEVQYVSEQLRRDVFSDQVWLEQIKMTHRGKNIDQAWNECYIHHSTSPHPPKEVWLWRQKLNTWLTMVKDTDKPKSKFISKPKI